MAKFNVEHVYGCGSIGELEIEADNEQEARNQLRDDYGFDSDDILSITELEAA